MKTMNVKALALAAAVLSATAAVHAHGEKAHDGAAKATTTAKEQKPWGIAADPRAAARRIEIRMTDDMRFSPDRIEVRQGETVRFVVTNAGGLMHEMVIGTKKELDEHAALMQKFPDMEHDEPHMVHVAAGKTGDLVWTFNRPGDFDFACLIAGHYQAGMRGTISVKPRRNPQGAAK